MLCRELSELAWEHLKEEAGGSKAALCGECMALLLVSEVNL